MPTMGGLHQGHAELIRRASQQGPVLLSVFVNPLQFGPAEDFDRYPRTLEADRVLAECSGAHSLWAPSVVAIYPSGLQSAVSRSAPADLKTHLCGSSRPGHFDGVVTVVARLLQLVEPSCLWLGEKDWQQLVILRRLVADLDLGVAVQGVPTVRESDGLALSSRNQYLSSVDRARAAALPAALRRADPSDPETSVRQSLAEAGLEVEYVDRVCLLYTSPSPRDGLLSRMPSSA